MKGCVEEYHTLLSVPFLLEDGRRVSVEFVVDTGFAGALTLPPAAVSAMGLPFLQEMTAHLADDNIVVTDVHIGTILWNGAVKEVAVLAMGRRPLLGTALLAELSLCVAFTEGGDVDVDPIGERR